MEPDTLQPASASVPTQREAGPWKQCLWLGIESALVLVSGGPAST